jgi:hypothetical protein
MNLKEQTEGVQKELTREVFEHKQKELKRG